MDTRYFLRPSAEVKCGEEDDDDDVSGKWAAMTDYSVDASKIA